MYKNVKIKLLLIACLGLFIGNVCLAEQANLSQDDIKFYGKVVDKSGKPVAGVVINIGIKKSNKAKGVYVDSTTATSDSQGLFEVSGLGSAAYIRTIEKPDYEFISKKGKMNFNYSSTTANNPAIFHMRKKNPPAFLLRNSYLLKFGLDDTTEYYLDIASGGLWDGQKLEKNPRLNSMLFQKVEVLPLDSNDIRPNMLIDHADIVVVGRPNRDGSEVEISFTCLDANSGLLVDDEIFYEAPADGYNTMAKMQIDITSKTAKLKKYLYVKSRDEQFYSRIDLSIATGSQGLTVIAKTWTNPDGSRNLEYDKQYQKAQRGTRRFQRFNSVPMGRRERVRQQDMAQYRTAKQRAKTRRAADSD
ncbi:MAG: carboxypeptidase-like regulatory domain-containing protein [Anaerohalosphaeraceae bacterium]|nr:carboxypeptidase-like regulatory domain-containing protein [Anaerohalosphaeraceae bacterium]